MAVTEAISIETYLNTSYEPDVEFIDGGLREKAVTGFPHGKLQGILFTWFRRHRKEWEIDCSIETRTQVNAERVRLPDLVVVRAGARVEGALTEAPLLAIEVLSPSDRYADLKQRAEDLARMGTGDIWLIDPATRTVEAWQHNGWAAVAGAMVQAAHSPCVLDLSWLWAEFDD